MEEENVMAGFHYELFFKPRELRTDREQLQVEIATIIYTSFDCSRDGIDTASLEVLREALKLNSRKTLSRMIQRRINKLEKGAVR
jgi:hypothetical protein